MFKKTVTYTDFNGVERTEDFYFHVTEAQAVELELSETGGLKASVERIIQAQDMPQIISVLKKLVLESYGVKSPDGRRFIKTDKVKEEFEQTEAYSKIFMELAFDDKKAAEFVNGLKAPIETVVSQPAELKPVE